MNRPNLCGRCGAPVQRGAHGCYYCGVSFEGAPPPRPSPNADPDVLRLLRANDKIEAIKRYRQLTGLGLKEAKEAVEDIERQFGHRTT